MLQQAKLLAGALVAVMFAVSLRAGQSPVLPVYNEIIGTGQSLSTGLFANPPISTTSQWPTMALMTNLGVRQVPDRGSVYALNPALITGLVPLVEARTPDRDGETIGAGITFESTNWRWRTVSRRGVCFRRTVSLGPTTRRSSVERCRIATRWPLSAGWPQS